MLLTKKNFKFQKKYAYSKGEDKYPHYILRGKKITKEQAEKIIVAETTANIFKYNSKTPSYDEFGQESIKKPLSIEEDIEAKEREKQIKALEDGSYGNDDADTFDSDDWLNERHQIFVGNSPLSYFVDALGNVGANFNTTKYPDMFEFIVEHLEYASKYPFLSYVIIYADYDSKAYEKRYIGDLYPPLFDNIEQNLEAFTYALHVHDGGLEVVNKDEAMRLYKKYQKEYSNDLIFSRSDYNEYVRDNFNTFDIPLILKNWDIKPKLKNEIKSAYKAETTKNMIQKINEWIKRKKHSYCDKEYLEYKNMSKELENIFNGKKTKLNISSDLYNEIKNYLEVIFKYHETANKTKDMEKYLKSVLSRNDYRAMSAVIHEYRYDRKSIEYVYKEEIKNYNGNGTLPLIKTMYNWNIRMFDELEHVRKGEETKLKYNKVVIKKLKQYLDEIVAEDGSEKERKVLKQIWIMESELRQKLDEKTYKTMLDTVLFTKSSTYDLEKEYKIFNDGRNMAISFMKEVKNAVKKKDYSLKSIDVKSYMKKYNKLYKEYRSIINTCLMYF